MVLTRPMPLKAPSSFARATSSCIVYSTCTESAAIVFLETRGRKYNIKSPSSVTFFRGTCYADLGLISRHSALPCECVLFECVCTPVCKSTQLQFNRMPPTPFAAKMTAWSWHHTSSSPPPLTYASIFHVHSSCWCGYRGYASDGRF